MERIEELEFVPQGRTSLVEIVKQIPKYTDREITKSPANYNGRLNVEQMYEIDKYLFNFLGENIESCFRRYYEAKRKGEQASDLRITIVALIERLKWCLLSKHLNGLISSLEATDNGDQKELNWIDVIRDSTTNGEYNSYATAYIKWRGEYNKISS